MLSANAILLRLRVCNELQGARANAGTKLSAKHSSRALMLRLRSIGQSPRVSSSMAAAVMKLLLMFKAVSCGQLPSARERHDNKSEGVNACQANAPLRSRDTNKVQLPLASCVIVSGAVD